jgi:Putative transposase
MRSCNPPSRQEPPHDRPGNEPVTPAHDRRHDDPEVRAEDPSRKGFFLPVRVLSRLFRRLFLEKLMAAHKTGYVKFFGGHVALADAQAFAAYLAPLRRAEWVVYAKRPFGGPQAVLAYLSRYTHRVAAVATPV